MATPSSWYADGGVSGYNAAQGASTPELFKLASAGSVDLNGVTRLQSLLSGVRNRIDAVARIAVGWDDYFLATADGKKIRATMFIAPASAFPAGVPTPTQIHTKRTRAYRAFSNPADGVPVLGTKNYVFEIEGVAGHQLDPNTKYWVLVVPTMGKPNGNPMNDTPLPSVPLDTLGRAVSVWSNRTPTAPVITSPESGSVVNASEVIDLAITATDPDAIVGGTSSSHRDYAGVQVQYAARPTPENPSPEWTDLPFTRTGTGEPSPGWYIKDSTSSPSTGGAATLWRTGTVPVRCGSNSAPAGYGRLPSGAWQVRVRTFDFGHPFDRTIKPLGRTMGNYWPGFYPATNISPWSEPVRVTITDQVPPPIPVSPVGSIAVTDDKPVTLTWMYRNTAAPPYAQATRTVQIRRVGEEWTTLISGASRSESLTIHDDGTLVDGPPGPVTDEPLNPGGYEPPAGAEGEYLSDPGFEGSTAGGWFSRNASELVALGTVRVISGVPPLVYGGRRALEVVHPSDTERLAVQRNIPGIATAHKTFALAGWVYRRSAGSVDYTLAWTDPVGNYVGWHTDTLTFAEGGWKRIEAPDIAKPAAAVRAELLLMFPAGDAHGTRLDGFSVKGYTGTTAPLPPLTDPNPPVEPPVSGNGSTPYRITARHEYEWRVQVTDSDNSASNYSEVGRFWMVPAPASGEERPLPSDTIDGATLGRGTHRVFVYRRGGKVRVGELRNLSHVDWARVRDDISTAKVVVSGWDVDCGNLLATLQTWAYELVIYRDNGFGVDRVWEGPITLLTYERDSVTIQAKDLMGYAYRRIIKQRMSDAGKKVTVVQRAAQVLQNVFAPDDPNLLPYLNVITRADDALQYRSVPAYARTAFEEVDDMAANAGLDYTVVGRAVLLWGTKHGIGRLPEFRDSDLGATPIVSEYGMSMANVYAVSDGNGTFGEATRLDVSGNDEKYGLVEMLSSSWATDTPEAAGTYTGEALATTVEAFKRYAEKTIEDRYPAPVVVRVPDNTSLNPSTVISIQQLVPGVTVPLRSTGTLRHVVANQKLDSVKVVETDGEETISITLSSFNRDDAAMVEEVEA